MRSESLGRMDGQWKSWKRDYAKKDLFGWVEEEGGKLDYAAIESPDDPAGESKDEKLNY